MPFWHIALIRGDKFAIAGVLSIIFGRELGLAHDGSKHIVSTLTIAIALAIGPAAHGQTTTFHDSSGRVTGRARIDTNGTTSYYNASGRVTGRTRTDTNGITTYYDASGRVVAKTSAPRR